MNFNKHSSRTQHAFLGGSNYHWLNYTEEKLINVYKNQLAVLRGVELHELAAKCITLKQRLPDTMQTLNMYVNDAISFRMLPEVLLVVSENCFGTADAISFRKNKLRIHDLKTGKNKASMNQLLIYAAMFCLEYKIKPKEITTELRIYQNDNKEIYIPEPEDIGTVMTRIKIFDRRIEKIKKEYY